MLALNTLLLKHDARWISGKENQNETSRYLIFTEAICPQQHIRFSLPLNTNVKIETKKFKDSDTTILAYVNCLWCQ